jgi:alkylation response protein AidB-like acyl-CoA dehydrogenase
MQFELDSEQRALRQELREYFAALLPPGSRSTGHGERSTTEDRAIMRQLGSDGWLGIGYPVEYGGQGRGGIDTFIFYDEALRAGAPVSHVTVMTVGPALIRWGTTEQKRDLLGPIIAGEVVFTIGYTEPEAGTDLSSLVTRATREGDEYVINGQKIYSSGAATADYIWLAARTDPGSRGSRGISILIVPTSSEGFSYTLIPTLSAHVTTSTYYDDVRVPDSALVGRQDEGWSVIADQLNHERLTLVMPGPLEQLYEDVLGWAATAETAQDGVVLDRPWVRRDLARVRAALDALRLLSWRAIWTVDEGGLGPGDAAVAKVLGSETFVESARLLLGILGPAGAVRRDAPGAILQGRVEAAYRAATIKTFGGGVNEVLREIIGRSSLGLPPVPRQLRTPVGA